MSHLTTFLIIFSAAQIPNAFGEPRFPDIFELLAGRDKLRFQYELNTLVDKEGEFR